jgi:hypothetical protein
MRSFNRIDKASQNRAVCARRAEDSRASQEAFRAMKTVRIAAAQTAAFREDIEAALSCAADVAARAETEGASLLCFPEGFLQGYLTDETMARRNALDLASPAFTA